MGPGKIVVYTHITTERKQELCTQIRYLKSHLFMYVWVFEKEE